MTESVRDRVAGFWDAQAASFDDEPDHGLEDRLVRDAWMARLRAWLPEPPVQVADLGCGTGSLSVLLVADPPFPPASVDVVLVRHLLWTLPDPQQAVATWIRLLRPGGTMVLIEGRWAQPDDTTDQDDQELEAALPWLGGVDAATLTGAVEPMVDTLVVHDLSDDPQLWGRPVHDERFALVAHAS